MSLWSIKTMTSCFALPVRSFGASRKVSLLLYFFRCKVHRSDNKTKMARLVCDVTECLPLLGVKWGLAQLSLVIQHAQFICNQIQQSDSVSSLIICVCGLDRVFSMMGLGFSLSKVATCRERRQKGVTPVILVA